MEGRKRGGWRSQRAQRPHRRLDVWAHGMTLARRIYEVTQDFPDDEKFGLVSQLRRSAVSIPSNIAEGSGRGTNADFLRFLYMARGSLNEVDTQLELSSQLGLLSETDVEDLGEPFDRLTRTLDGLIRSLRS